MHDARWLSPEQAAAYLSVRVDALPRLVRQGRVPAPAYTLGDRSPRYDKLKLDAAFDGGTGSTDPRTASAANAAKIIEKGRSRRAIQARGRNAG